MIIAKRVFPYLATAILILAIVYLTPLKWINIIEPSIKDIDPITFQSDFVKNSDHYIFIDVRSEVAYNKLHAAGSLNIPLHTLYDQRHVLPKSGKKIVLICSGGRASGVAYSYLEHYGFFNIERIEGGIEQWVTEGLPVESSVALEKSVSMLSTGLLVPSMLQFPT